MAIRSSEKSEKVIKRSIEIDYNPYYLNTEIKFENIPLERLTKTLQILELEKKENKIIQLWIENFLQNLFIELNTDKICVSFKGRVIDFEDIKEILLDYPNCELIFTEKYRDKNFKNNLSKIMEELINLKKKYRLSIDTSKYSELFKDEIKIAVMAPMSSGKSTLINALLGNEILPAENIACTSKVFEIINNKNLLKGEYEARLILDSKPISNWEKVEKETLDILQKKIDNGININTKIELAGNFPFLSDENYNIKLIDTPGPNNDNNSDHRQESFNFIKNEKDCIILYVLDSTSLTTKDSGEYIEEIAKFLNENENEKELSDKIVFILNKFDCASISKGEDKRIYQDALAFLKNKGIQNPKIFPISSFFINSLRKGFINFDEEKVPEDLSEEYDEFKKIEKKFTKYNLNTLDFTPLSENLKKKLSEEKNEIKKLENLGGITAIEYYIKRHISRYYLVYKMNLALNKVLGDIKREIGITSIAFEDGNKIIENTKIQEKKKSEKIQEIKEFLKSYEKKYLKKIEDVYTQQFYSAMRNHTSEIIQNNSKHVNEKNLKKIYENLEIFSNLQSELIEVNLKSILIQASKELEEEVVRKLKKYVDSFNQKDIFDSFLVDLKLDLKFDEITKLVIKNKSKVEFEFFSFETWGTLLGAEYKIENLLAEIVKLNHKNVNSHQALTIERYKENMDLLKENFEKVTEKIFEKISETVKEMEEKSKDLKNLKKLKITLEELLKKIEDLILNNSFVDSLIDTFSIPKVNEIENSVKLFSDKLKSINLTENISILSLGEVENSLKNVISGTQKIVDEYNKIQVSDSFTKMREKITKVIKK